MNSRILAKELQSSEPNDPYDRRYCGAVLFDKEDNVILQARDQKPGIVNPGMTTLFGGGQEANETSSDCILRELHEELDLTLGYNEISFLGYIDKQETDGTITRCSIFRADGIDVSSLNLQEGYAIAVQPAQDYLRSSSVSEVTKISIQAAIQ